jgi:hypothetical protein
MKRALIVFAFPVVFALLVIGCSSFSTVNPRAMTIDQIIAMSAAGAGADVIKDQMLATGSKFRLTAEDIVRLKNEDVADDVIRAMIETGGRDRYSTGPDYYDPWFGSSPMYGGYSPFYGYGYPYEVWRQPGLIGRFYTYSYPLSPWDRYGPTSSRWRNEYTTPDSTGTWMRR